MNTDLELRKILYAVATKETYVNLDKDMSDEKLMSLSFSLLDNMICIDRDKTSIQIIKLRNECNNISVQYIDLEPYLLFHPHDIDKALVTCKMIRQAFPDNKIYMTPYICPSDGDWELHIYLDHSFDCAASKFDAILKINKNVRKKKIEPIFIDTMNYECKAKFNLYEI